MCCEEGFSWCFVSAAKPSEVDMNAMPEMDRRIMERQILEDTNSIIEQYALLRSRTMDYLEQINCGVKKLLVCIRDVQHVKRISKKYPLAELDAETCIDGIFLELVKKNLISFMQFSILKRVVTELCSGSPQLQQRLKSYEVEFTKYIQRRVCETRIYHEGRFEAFSGNTTGEKVELLIITDENWNNGIEFLKVVDLEMLVAKCLKINRFSLQIVSIEPQCLKIRYAISIHVAECVFPLTSEEWKELSSHGIIQMQCLDYFYSTDEKGKLVV